MENKLIAFIDIETTGLDFLKHEIIEIGCVLARQDGKNLEIQSEHEWKVKPQKIESADPEALQINGYDPSQWVFAADLGTALAELSDITAGAWFAAHNSTFDFAFLQKGFAENGVENKMDYHKLDTITYAIAKLENKPEISRYSLRALCDYFGVENVRAHTALSDARATAAVYQKLLEI